MVRTCDHCRKVLVEFPRNDRQAEAHCSSKNCHFCMTCMRAKFRQIKEG